MRRRVVTISRISLHAYSIIPTFSTIKISNKHKVCGVRLKSVRTSKQVNSILAFNGIISITANDNWLLVHSGFDTYLNDPLWSKMVNILDKTISFR
ncbi:hypothetical protein GJ496_007417 [Pomphorhynchus laevis]|nr:hypothetical protein GJ496_007417 [Pomphorhynchus laevis]